MTRPGSVPLVGQVYRVLNRKVDEFWEQQQRRRVEEILERPEAPSTYDSEEVFTRLQREYPPREDYAWDAFAAWSRGVQRVPGLIKLAGREEPGARVLEATCGDGMTGVVIASYGHSLTLHDLEDWRDSRAREFPFVAGDLCTRLPLEDESFDLIFSYNAFEHVYDPAAALKELVRLCSTGGMIYLDFGPLFCSPWGLHAWTALGMPYPQFLFSPEFYQRKIDQHGLYDLGNRTTTLQPLNRWRLAEFEQLWRESGCEVVAYSTREDVTCLDVVERFPRAFTGTGLSFADVTSFQISVALRKPGAV
jgi:SAM-dependent methyltransferase